LHKSIKHLAVHYTRHSATCPCWNTFFQSSNTLKQRTRPTDPRLPITIQALVNLKPVWLSPSPHLVKFMLWAVSYTGFFGFLRAGEFTIPSRDGSRNIEGRGDQSAQAGLNPFMSGYALSKAVYNRYIRLTFGHYQAEGAVWCKM